jgi:hypothetical protein
LSTVFKFGFELIIPWLKESKLFCNYSLVRAFLAISFGLNKTVMNKTPVLVAAIPTPIFYQFGLI